MLNRTQIKQLPETKCKLLDAGVSLMRHRGFNATTVDEVCAEAGVTKGGFFHYFKSKDDLATAAVDRFYEVKAKQFADAPFRGLADPLDRIFGRLDFVNESGAASRALRRAVFSGCLLRKCHLVIRGCVVCARLNLRRSARISKAISQKLKPVTPPGLLLTQKTSRCSMSPSCKAL